MAAITASDVVMVFTQLENLKVMYVANMDDPDRMREIKDLMIAYIDKLEPEQDVRI